MKISLRLPVLAATLGTAAIGGTLQAAPLPPPDPATFLGSFTGQSGSNSKSFGNQVSGSFDDLYSLETTSRSLIGLSVTSKYQAATAFISDFTVSLYSGPPSTATLIVIETDGKAISSSGIGFQLVDLNSARNAGTFYFTVSGRTNNTPSYAGSLNLTVSAVPLPASAPLFGAAVLALGVAGYRLSRKTSAVA